MRPNEAREADYADYEFRSVHTLMVCGLGSLL